MTFNLTIDTDNAAFDDDMPAEVARILRTAAQTIRENGGSRGSLYDSNGNTCGGWAFEIHINRKD